MHLFLAENKSIVVRIFAQSALRYVLADKLCNHHRYAEEF